MRLRSRLHHIRKIEFVLGRNGFDIAAVARRAKTELIEEGAVPGWRGLTSQMISRRIN
jgi:hypothetical protein